MGRKVTSDELRERAEAVLATAQERARAALVAGEDEAESLHVKADRLELVERVAAGKARFTQEAAEAAQAGLEARDAGRAATAEAAEQSALKAALVVDLQQIEEERRSLLERIERRTADGRPDEAATLERNLGEVDPVPLRERLALADAAEQAARERAGRLTALAEQKQAESAELRRQLGEVEPELRLEFEERRRARKMGRAARILIFDERGPAYLVAMRAAPGLIEDAARVVDSASAVWPDGPVVEIDGERRLSGVHVPFTR